MSIAPESNPPINPWYYQPSRFPISAISAGRTTTITMTATDAGGITVEPNYVIGQQVRITVPYSYGMRQINNQTAYVVSIPSALEVVVDIDSTEYDSFISSPSFGLVPAQITAIGDVNSGQINTGITGQTTYVPGSFIDIS